MTSRKARGQNAGGVALHGVDRAVNYYRQRRCLQRGAAAQDAKLPQGIWTVGGDCNRSCRIVSGGGGGGAKARFLKQVVSGQERNKKN